MYEKIIQPNLKLLNQKEKFKNITFQKVVKQPLNILNSLTTATKYAVKKCNKPRCKTCNILIEYKGEIIIKGKKIIINKNANCQSKGLIYLIECKCKKIYIGETRNQFNIRINLHRNQTENIEYTILPANKHMRECNSDYKATILFISEKEELLYLSKMEHYFINLLKPELNID